MSYTKTIWAKGDEITEEKLNNLEEGVAAAHLEANKGQNEVLPEQTFDGWTASASGTFGCHAPDTGGVAPIPGESYAVRWDEKEYICKCYEKMEISGLVFTGAAIGNGDLLGVSNAKTDDPFLLFGSEGQWFMFTSEAGDSHKVGVRLAPLVNPGQIKAAADDEGKILKVVNGKAAWVAVAQAEDASF